MKISPKKTVLYLLIIIYFVFEKREREKKLIRFSPIENGMKCVLWFFYTDLLVNNNNNAKI